MLALKVSANAILTFTLGWAWLQFNQRTVTFEQIKAFMIELNNRLKILKPKGYFLEASLQKELEIFEKNAFYKAEGITNFSIADEVEKREVLRQIDEAIKELSPALSFERGKEVFKEIFKKVWKL